MAETEADQDNHGGERWERDALARLASASLAEQRRARRWGILFKSLVLLYLFAVLLVAINAGPLFGGDFAKRTGPHTALVDVQGLIASSSDANADRIATGLRRAFEDPNTRGVIVRINSPGGSPVQSGMIYDEIRRLRQAHPDTPVYAVATDLCASGGYYVAAAADRIYASQASMVGSIGVRFGGFGFVQAIDELGIERRLITAGENKAMLDPFLPEDPEDVAHVERMIGTVHDQFIEDVRAGRGKRIDTDAHPDLFSGLVWTGEQAIDKGLVDALGSPGFVAREVVGAEEIVDFTPQKDFLERLSDRMSAAVAETLRTQALVPNWQ
ncbi:MAG: S49 family peptidase [Proteobacteria bacterium SW_6_67_9]|nr:MAG: S49 family peptidase [Proteobacteria bacterium SW_6_67_9]